MEENDKNWGEMEKTDLSASVKPCLNFPHFLH